jgi:hypothetical protein
MGNRAASRERIKPPSNNSVSHTSPDKSCVSAHVYALLAPHLPAPFLATIVIDYARTRLADLVLWSRYDSRTDLAQTWVSGPYGCDALAGWRLTVPSRKVTSTERIDRAHAIVMAIDLIGLPGLTIVYRTRNRQSHSPEWRLWMVRFVVSRNADGINGGNNDGNNIEGDITLYQHAAMTTPTWANVWTDGAYLYSTGDGVGDGEHMWQWGTHQRRWCVTSVRIIPTRNPSSSPSSSWPPPRTDIARRAADVCGYSYDGFRLWLDTRRLCWLRPSGADVTTATVFAAYHECALPADGWDVGMAYRLHVDRATGRLFVATRCCDGSMTTPRQHEEVATVWSCVLVMQHSDSGYGRNDDSHVSAIDAAEDGAVAISHKTRLTIDPTTWTTARVKLDNATIKDNSYVHSPLQHYTTSGTLPDGRVYFSDGYHFVVQTHVDRVDEWRQSERGERLGHALLNVCTSYCASQSCSACTVVASVA